MKVRVRVIISGMVQGVGFRSSIRNEAQMTGVKGYVKNRTDGKVEAVFEGENTDVINMVEFCRRGVPGAEVDDIDVRKESFSEEFSSFEIRY